MRVTESTTVELDGETVTINKYESKDGTESTFIAEKADTQQPFQEYVEENIVAYGLYEFENVETDLRYDLKLQDPQGGCGGFITRKTIRNAVEDDGVDVYGVKKGKLVLEDTR